MYDELTICYVKNYIFEGYKLIGYKACPYTGNGAATRIALPLYGR